MASPSLDQLVTDLLRATWLLVRRARAEHPHELSLPQFQVMARLVESGPMTTADLARAEAVKPQSMGATLAPLERDGLIARDSHPTDGRQMLVRLTAKGENIRQHNKAATRDWLAGAIGRLSRDERHALAAATAILRKLTDDPTP
jgi:DNA-binding MarR family transcriptional regulator